MEFTGGFFSLKNHPHFIIVVLSIYTNSIDNRKLYTTPQTMNDE
jgi:hypothetical protein